MADTKISALTTATPADADYVPGVDVSDTTQSPQGSTARFLFSAIWSYISGKLGALATLSAVTGDSVVAKAGAGAGNFAELAAPNDTVLRRLGGSLAFGKLTASLFNANIVTNALLSQVAQATLKGRKTAGTGNVEDLTMADLVALLDGYFGNTTWRSGGSGSNITVGSGAPSAAPASTGLLYVDTNLYDLYFSTGTATVADWKKAIDNDDGAAIAVKASPALADTVFQFDSANGDAPVISTWSDVIAALKLVALDASGRLVNPKTVYTSFDGGSPAAASTYTPAAADGNVQHLVNNAAFTLAPPATPGSFIVEIVNGATAGAITTAGFTAVSGDALTTTNGHKFVATITVSNSVSHLNVKAMQ